MRLTNASTHEARSDVTIREIISRLSAYEDAEEQGRLAILPCKVGDVVWRIAIGTRGKRRSAYPQYVIYEFRISEVYGSKSIMFFGPNRRLCCCIYRGRSSASEKRYFSSHFYSRTGSSLSV